MLSIAIPSLNFCGGAELVTLELINILKDYDIQLLTVDKPNWNKIKHILNYEFNIKQRYKLNYDITSNMNIINMMRLILLYNKLLNDNKNVINMYGDLDIFIDKGYITYINGIPFSIIDNNNAPLYMNTLIRSLYKIFVKPKNKNIIISNSYYIKNKIKDKLNLDSIVIHPPIVIKDYNSNSKEDIILTVSRIRRGKRLDRVIRLARENKDLEFIIIGHVYDLKYYNELLNMSKGVNNLKIITNKPRYIILDYLRKARILLHAMDNEGYGMSIVEGMLNDCIPIVPKNGGPWIDILEEKNGIYGYAYSNLEEASKYIRLAMNDNSIAKRAREQAKRLANEFYIRFLELLRSINYI